MMRKYIVEAPEPRKGQKVSSGGIRENGRLASQFKNPMPYEEPIPPAIITQRLDTKLIREEMARARRVEARMYLLGLAWQELGEPILRSGLRKLGNIIINRIETPAIPPMQHNSFPESVVIDAGADEIEAVYDENTLPFPNRKVI